MKDSKMKDSPIKTLNQRKKEKRRERQVRRQLETEFVSEFLGLEPKMIQPE